MSQSEDVSRYLTYSESDMLKKGYRGLAVEDVHQQDSINSCTQAVAIGYDIPHLHDERLHSHEQLLCKSAGSEQQLNKAFPKEITST